MMSLSHVNLAALRAVEAVARLGSLSAAAVELGVTPGAISQQVLKAEAHLTCTLFDRRPKGMVPTAMGREVATHLTDGFAALARGVEVTRAHQEDAITVSVAPVFAAKWLVRRLGDFAQAHPDVAVRIDASTSLVTPRRGHVDVCIRVGRGGWPDAAAEQLFAQRVFPVCAPQIAASLGTLDDLRGVPIIREQSNALFGWDVWLGPNDMSETDLRKGPVFSDAGLCLDAAIAGQGVFLAMETLAQDALAMGQVVAPFPGRFATGVSYWFVEPKEQRRPPHVEAFRAWLVGALKTRTAP